MSYKTFKGGDLVKDNLNTGPGNYGLGGIVRSVPPPRHSATTPRKDEVYFTKFARTITVDGYNHEGG